MFTLSSSGSCRTLYTSVVSFSHNWCRDHQIVQNAVPCFHPIRWLFGSSVSADEDRFLFLQQLLCNLIADVDWAPAIVSHHPQQQQRVSSHARRPRSPAFIILWRGPWSSSWWTLWVRVNASWSRVRGGSCKVTAETPPPCSPPWWCHSGTLQTWRRDEELLLIPSGANQDSEMV